ncbi:hypothetical protein [Dyadobacter sp. LHD-138]
MYWKSKNSRYSTSAKKVAYAVDAVTGKQIWRYDPFDVHKSLV